ncbi:MAG: flagellar M-ring protein FliF [Dehalococcoidia bacterium]|nr:flagellar M-ring protein FliF [Dehalococcoidia bacterium]
MGADSPIGAMIERWNQLPRARQIALAGIAGGALLLLYFVFIASSKPNLVVAYSGLQPEDSAAIADQLEKDGISYEVGGGGSSISVPANQVAEVRIKLAQAGLPKGTASTGLEIFDKTNFGATDFVQQVNYRRGLEGELARSINTLDGVRASRVHIVIPKEAIFQEDQQQTTASVLLQLQRGARLNQDQVRGITNLVANSVEGLQPSGVTIIDETGHVLFDGATLDSAFSTGASASQMELQRSYELQLQRDVEQTLGKVVGPGRSAVTVRAALNFDTVKRVQDEFGGEDDIVIRSETTTTETYTANNLNVGQVPGTGANGPADPGGNVLNGESNYTRTESTTNNEIPRTTTETVQAPGAVERLSVSVVLDESVTAAQEANIASAVAAAVGLDQIRGDTLSVTRLPFDVSVREELLPAAADGIGTYLSYLKLLLPLLAVVLAFILVMLLLRSLSKRQLVLPAPAPALAVEAAPSTVALAPPPEDLPALDAPADPHEERVVRLAEANPQAVADVVQTWMREEEKN